MRVSAFAVILSLAMSLAAALCTAAEPPLPNATLKQRAPAGVGPKGEFQVPFLQQVSSKCDPAICSAQVETILLQAEPADLQAARLPSLSEVLRLPKSAAGKEDGHTCSADSHASRMLYGIRNLPLFQITVTDTSIALIDGTQLLVAERDRKSGRTDNVARLLPATGSLITRGGNAEMTTSAKFNFATAFIGLDHDVATISYSLSEETTFVKLGQNGGKDSPSTTRVLSAEGEIKLRVGETHFQRVIAIFSDPAERVPVDAVFAITLVELGKPKPALDHSRPQTGDVALPYYTDE